MYADDFAKPVYVRDGKFVIREISDLEDAIEFMNRWPEGDRGRDYETTLRALRLASSGVEPAKAARDAFRAFAKSRDILEKDAAFRPWMVLKGYGEGAGA